MEINSIHKYIALNKLANGSTEVLFAGQPCLTVSEANVWKINPVFAKLVYGANVFEDIPVCSDTFSSSEEAIAGGLVKLHELGAFNTEYDFPEDTYAATMNVIKEDVKKKSISETANIMEAHAQFTKEMTVLFGKQTKAVTLKEEEKNYDDEYDAWESSVRAAHPEKKLSFKSRIESRGELHTTSAEMAGRSYGVWDHNDNTGKVFEAEEEKEKEPEKEPEKKEEAEIVAALKKDKIFIAKVKGAL